MSSWTELICLGIDAAIFGVLYAAYRKSISDIKAVKEVPHLECDANLLKLVASAPEKTVPYAAVKGTVVSLGPPLKSQNSPDVSGVIQKLVLKEHKTELNRGGFWLDQERTIRDVTNVVPFILLNKGIGIEVTDPLSADYLELTTIADKFQPAKIGVGEYVWGWFMGERQKGIQDIEEMLQEGVSVTGIGSIVDTAEGLKLRKPCNSLPYILTSLPVSTYIRHLETKNKLLKIFYYIFGTVGIVLFVMVARKYWRIWKRMKEEEEHQRMLEETRLERMSNARSDNGSIPDYQLCVICLTNPKEVILLNCGHVCVCADCAENMEKKCPVCRKEVVRFQAAYIV